MSERTVLAVSALGDRLIARIVRAPFQVLGESLDILDLDPDQMPDLQTNDSVLARGKLVRDALRKNQGIRDLLDALSATMAHQVRPLCVQLGRSDAERINWEMLCDQNDAFVALDQRWPIARIIDPINATQRIRRELTTPVRLMAIISALGIRDQRTEWESLRQAVEYARGIGLRVVFKAMIGDSDLLNEIEQAISAEKAANKPGANDIEVAAIEATPARLTQSIRMWSPNILHLFCHGNADSEEQSLEFATANDHEQFKAKDPNTTAGSVVVDARKLVDLSGLLVNPWLLVLNCCSSGKAGLGLQSMANQIVSRGFPAVVAMTESVGAKDAYELTRAFYPQAFDLLKTTSDQLTQHSSVSLDWAPLMHQVRYAICGLGGRVAENSPEWSMPVLYLRGVDPHEFDRPQGLTPQQLEDYRVIVEWTANWLRTAGTHLTEAQRIEAMEDALKHVPRSLWPSVNGNLNDAANKP
jgi:hypothetical protein